MRDRENLSYFCNRPFDRIYIGYDGSAVLCCSDWRFEEILGNVKDQSLMDVWTGERVRAIREKLLNDDRSGMLCEYCDFLGYQPKEDDTECFW